MRYIDLALAALVGTSAVAGIASWNPSPGDSAAHQMGVQIVLRDQIIDILQQRGLTQVLQDPASFCSYVNGLSNSTFGVYAQTLSMSCGSPPERGAVSSTLAMDLLPSEATFVAWSLD
jgi:hypothetical protein